MRIPDVFATPRVNAPARVALRQLLLVFAVVCLWSAAGISLPQAAENAPNGETPAAAPPVTASSGITPGTGPNAIVPPVTPAAPVIAAKTLFGAANAPAPLEARAIGYYSRGCLSGARQMPVDGPEWQAMRLSRNRNWGHPALISFLERFAADAHRLDGWPGLLVGDMSQPRGGPMLTGHASHQVGLDADLWLTPMPSRRLTRQEREDTSAVSMLAAGDLAINPQVFTLGHVRLLKRAASYNDVERIFVHPAIKKALCEATSGEPDRTWLHKVRPTWGHDHHFHVRLNCPAGFAGCKPQTPPGADDGCGKELADWYALLTAPPKAPEPPSPPLTLDNLPAECRLVLSAGQTTNAAAKPRRK